MPTVTDRGNLLRTLYEAAGLTEGARSRGAERLELSVRGLELRAWITQDVSLDMELRVTDWDPEVERTLYDALDRSETLVAGLLLWEWPEVRRACAAANREALRGT